MIINKKIFKKNFLFQLILTLLVTLASSFLSTVLDGDWRYYLPLRALLIILISILICFLIGLPIRLNTKINTWWIQHQLLPLAGILAGFILLFLSWLPNFREVDSYYDIVMEKTNPYLSITGWFLTVFCLLHSYPPRAFSGWVTRVCASVFSKKKAGPGTI